MKRSLLLGALVLGLIGCGGEGALGSSAEGVVDRWIDDLDSAYAYGLSQSDPTRITAQYGSIVSASYCDSSGSRTDLLRDFRNDVEDAQADRGDQVRITDTDIRNARYESAERRVVADVYFVVRFYDDGGNQLFRRTVEDSTFALEREGSTFRLYGDQSGCSLSRSDTPSKG